MKSFDELKNMFGRSLHETFRNFNLIPNDQRLHSNRKLCGMLKVTSLLKRPDKFNCFITHGNILCLAEVGALIDNVTQQDVVYMQRCGLFWFDKYSAIGMFV